MMPTTPSGCGSRRFFAGQNCGCVATRCGAIQDVRCLRACLISPCTSSVSAIVVSIAPELIIGAYSDDLDAIVLLRFDPTWVERLHLVVGMRVLTINTYMRGSRVSPDVEEGARSARRWVNVYPLIAETLCDDSLLVQKRKAEIDAELWGRAEDLVAEMTRRDRVHLRDGSPLGARKRGILSPFPRG